MTVKNWTPKGKRLMTNQDRRSKRGADKKTTKRGLKYNRPLSTRSHTAAREGESRGSVTSTPAHTDTSSSTEESREERQQ